MLTRLEAHGFKNLLGFSIDFGAFTCLAGPNGVGKSNVFDAIRFFALLADQTMMDAALSLRGGEPETADLRDLFWTDGSQWTDSFSLAAEMIVDAEVEDDFGRPAEASSTFLRYEIEVGYEKPGKRATLGRLVLLREALKYITEGEAANRLRFPHSAKDFRQAAVTNKRRSRAGFISTETASDGQREILVHQDGGSRGSPQRAPASTAPRTIVATSNTSATPTILAARREMQSWRTLALEPTAMRRPDRFHDDPHISPDGGHVPATLYRLATSRSNRGEEDPRAYAEVARRLGDLLSVRMLGIDRDDVRQLLTLWVSEPSGARLPARSLSDGTLRFLTLSTLENDPTATGVLCMEEPENGIHPAKMAAMVNLLRDLAIDPSEAPSTENPMRQVVVATHSPALVQLQDPNDLLFAVETSVRSPAGTPAETLRCRPLTDTWRDTGEVRSVGKGTILAYLTVPPGAQISIEDVDAFEPLTT